MAYPSNSGDSVAHTQIRAFVERVERLDEELKAINDDKKEIFAEARGNGFDITALKQVIKLRRQDANERMEREAIVELYMSALGMVPPPEYEALPVQVQARVENIEQFGSNEAETEPQPAPQAGSDLTTPAPLNGQVASNQPETVAPSAEPERASAEDGSEASPVLANSDPASNGGSQSPDVVGRDTDDAAPSSGEAQQPIAATGKPAEGQASAAPALYAEPGIVTWELTPPEGVERHEYSAAFGDIGQDIAVIEEDLLAARAEPIVKIGNRILDGWARYMKARELGIEYPVVQYDGHDFLLDCIKWNLAGRILTDAQKSLITKRLIAAYPQRKGIIIAAMEMDTEMVA
ncbi:hypothetical protein FF80_03317 [Devosia sp. LC5]|uniref:DUF2312 domain-containing protein n=1 Tax=Devosia sp. LC5 TaxID=1502724 RepID=UPI0004E3436D|nr:hypothetical protein FF80_03317 [Devosia sp. LC5]